MRQAQGVGNVIRAYIAAAFAGLLSILGALLYRMGVKAKESENQEDDFNEYIATRDRMEKADPGSDVDKWLRERAKRDGNL